ncbi:divalent metal cation transporter [Hymenobacter sp. DH14]|uniref:Divalent metal cation transporter n=1 Tax=Hymenobacter cyanobacteriorum TaxID=2926463 RepID=A0A9X2AHF4_9BACT|nr:divalent metal cation transporter [Hymenobacter cyanobacteriorum]MCI1189802.1 divalent metal cation transporter [Hymenobacter cyanobacteriorum]
MLPEPSLTPPPTRPMPAYPRLLRVIRFVRSLGPGLITGASDDDPSGIATYSQAGAAFGLATLWTALLTFPLMAAMQEMCARIGLVTQQGLAGTLRKHYPRWVLYGLLLFTFPAIVLNIGADLEGMGAVAHLLVPQVPTFAFSVLFTGLMLVAIIRFPYQRLASILKWLCCVLLVYLVVPFLVKQDWANVAHHTFIPEIQFTKAFAAMLVAILGTTISPYLFFWQAEMEAEEMQHRSIANGHGRRVMVNKRLLQGMQADVNVGMFCSNLIMFFIILTTGVVLYSAGIHQIDTVEQAASALRPLAGESAYLLFAGGVIGTGLLAIPVLAGSLSYATAETFHWRSGLDRQLRQAPAFYGTIALSLVAGVLLDLFGISPIQALLYTAILYGLTAPVMIAIVLHLANNKSVMGELANGKVSNTLGLVTLVLMSAAAVLLLYFQLAG